MRRMLVGDRVLPVAVAVLVALGLGTTSCSWVKDPNAQPKSQEGATAQAALPTERPTAWPVGFNNPAATTFAEDGVIAAAAGRDVVVTATPQGAIGRRLPGLEQAYSLSTTGGQITDLHVDHDAGTGYLLEATNEVGSGTFIGEDTFTVTRFDLDSGEILDVATAVLPQDPDGDALPASGTIAGVAADVVLIESVVGEAGAHATLAVDVRLDDVLWRKRPARVLATTPNRVVVGTGRPGAPGAVEALALQSGDRRWSALRGVEAVSGAGATDETVTVVRDTMAGAEVVPLDLRTGKPGESTPTAEWNWGCHPTTTAVVVCTMAGDDDVLGWNLETGRIAWSLPSEDRFAPLVTLVQEDRVYGLLDSGVGVVLDAVTGRDLADNTGAAPVAVNPWGGVVLYQQKAVFMPGLALPAASASPTPTPDPDTEDGAAG